MSTATPRSTGCWLLWLRADLPRDQARAYWRGPHAERVGSVPHVREYRQHHFAPADHGFWRSPPTVGAAVPPDWRIDGMPEVEFQSTLGALLAVRPTIGAVFTDEANAFDRTLCHLSGPSGGRRHDTASKEKVGARAVVLVRRRPRVLGRAFRRFVHQTLGQALATAGQATELRTHVFLPYSRATWPTPRVCHDNPPHRRYHAAIVIGAQDRAALDGLLESASVMATGAAQRDHCLALHAYAIEETVTVVKP